MDLVNPLRLHTIWTGHVFNLWVERIGPPRTRLGARRRNTVVPHPFALSDRALDEARALFHDRPLTETFLHKRIPTDSCGPIYSTEDVPADAVLAIYRLPALRLECAAALPLLLGFACDARRLAPAEDTLVWQAAARWAVRLMARGKVVPTLSVDATIASASWDAVLDDPADQTCLSWLEAALPTSGLLDQDVARRALLAFVGAAVRRTAQTVASRPDGRKAGLPSGWPRPALKWVEALRQGTSHFNAPRRALQTLEQEVARWTRPLREGRRPTLCFRLVPPASDATGAHAAWSVEVRVGALRASDLPLLRLSQCQDASALAVTPWAPLADELGAQVDALLKEARDVLPALSRDVDRLALEDEAAVAFILEQAALLQERGFTVWVPDGLPMQTSSLDLALDVFADGSGELGRETLLQYGWQISVEGQPVDLRRLQDASTNGKRRLLKIGGAWVMLDGAQIARAAAMVAGGANGSLGEAMRLAATADDARVSVGWRGVLAGLGEGVPPHETPVPSTLRAALRPYQQRGLSWLAYMRGLGLGTCLADDMGLGKTIQIISLLLHDQASGRADGPVLLVCPTSLVGNWRREIERFGPSLRTLVHHGGTRDRDDGFVRAAGRVDVVLTTYGLVPRDHSTLCAVAWRGVVLDEAQNIKNPQAAQTQAVCALPAEFRIALTGTPVENRLTDLWSVVNFLNPGLLGTATAFHRRFTAPIQKNGDTNALARLRQAVAPLLLRRCKTDPRVIADLPEKLEMKVYCPLSDEQARLYRGVTESLLDEVGAMDGMRRRSSILTALMRLKQICNHPTSIGEDGPLGGRSGKLDRLEEMLEEVVASGERGLVFTQFAEWGERLVPYLAERLACEVLWLHGGTPRAQRDAMVERFDALRDAAVLVLSLRAGGTGLNLVNANHVFHFDRWWNPAVENQATDRAFRIGQTRNVQVHKFICEGTLEESIDRLIERKTELAQGVLGSGEAWLTELSTDDLRQLVELREDPVAVSV